MYNTGFLDPTDGGNPGKMKIEFQVWKNQWFCKKKLDKSEGKNPGILLWFMIDDARIHDSS